MKSYIIRLVLLLSIGLLGYVSYGQEYNNFEVRYQSNLRGDLTFIGNNILNRDSGTAGEGPNDAYNNQRNNNNGSTNNDNSGFYNYNDFKNMQYIDVDSDPSTFSSSTSTFAFEQANCNLIRYAGLYWSATYPSATANGSYIGGSYTANTVPVGTGRQTDFNQVKFRIPGGVYVDITADEVLFDGFTSTDASVQQNSPYACYADVTSLITAMADPTGDYTVANIRATTGGLTPGGGTTGGWTLVIVYENPTLTGKFITTFDGFARVNGTNTVDINYNGFETIPVGPVIADLGAATLEGDFRITGDGLSIEAASNSGFTDVGNAANPTDNFFNSNITLDGVITTNRNPASTNTLGYDTDIFLLSNPTNSVIPNNETAATFRFSTDGDQYYPFFNSFNVEVIEPNIVLEKRVEDIAGNDITGAGVNLGQFLDYVLSFQNIGNDDAVNYTIRDILPINVTLDETNLTLPTGVTYTYTPATREVVFTFPDNLVEENDPASSIRMRVQVAENCFDFIDACTDQIENVAFSTYQGEINSAVITDDPSVNDFDDCGFVTPGATNFLLDDLESCDFSRTVQLCGDSVVLDAGDNFDDYIWYIDENGDGLIDAGDTLIPGENTDTLLVTEVGTYIVDKIIADPCKGFQEIITVTQFGVTQTNPIIGLINDTSNTVEGEIVVCPNDGEELPEIFLCGLNDTELIQINIPDALSIEWEQLDEASCAAATNDCANKNNTCTWNNVGNGGDFTASDSGQYRVVINYLNGCFTRFYFNIFKNPLDPQFNSSDIICSTPGNITVTNMPLDYEFQLVDATNDNILVPYSANNGPSFSIATNGAYRVEMRQQGVTDGCVFILDNIGILDRDFQVDVVTRDTDCNGLGEISISVLNVEAQYYYEISQGGTTVDTFGPSNDNNYTFENLNDGVYDILVSTDDGCNYTEQVTINDLSDLDLNARVSQHISCREGNIQMESTGGQTPHTYAIWSFVDESGTTITSYPDVNDIPPSEYQTSVIFDVLIPGDYTFVVVDRNNCHAFSNTVTIILVPAVEYTRDSTDETCFGANDGAININLTDSNGYQVTYYLIDDTGVEIATNNSGFFGNLAQGDYSVRINQRRGGSECDYFEDFIISGPPDAVTGTAAITQDYTCLQDGIITVQTASGGTAPYEYSIDGINFDGSAGADVFANLTDGAYNISIRDANDCIFVTPDIIIAPLNPPTDLTFTATNPVCPSLVSDVTATVVNGDAPFVFEIIAPSTIAATSTAGNSADFDTLSPGTYTFRVTDDKGCIYEESFTINPVSPITAVGQLVSNITCFDDTDGEARFTIANFNASYDYSVTGPSNFTGTNETNGTIDLTNLDDGTYTINVTDNDTNCTATATVTINGPPAAITITEAETQPTCTTDGSAQITAVGGWGSYTYVLNNPDTTPVSTNTNGTFNNLTQYGVYNGTVTDVNGCVEPFSFELFEAFPPVLAIAPNDFCYDDATGLTLTATITSGGNGNFEYSLNSGPYDTPNVFSGLGPGTYRIDVRDGNNCTDFATITINPELSVIASAPNITACATTTDVNVTAAGGDGNYVYAIVADGATPGAFSTTNPIAITGTGDYDVYVRDNSGNAGYCEASFDLTIAQDAPLAISVSNTDILCSGSSTSTITITASGGEAPYRYSIDNGTTYETTNAFVNQAAGSYNIRVLDANNCDIAQTYTITEPFTLSASAAVTALVECNPTAGAEVRITNAQGGTAPYEYSFDGGTNYGTSAIGFLLEGTHTLYIRDDNDCTFEMTVTVDPQPTPPTLSAAVDYECDGEGTITVTPSSTDFDYTYSISVNGGALTPNTPNTSNIFNDVAVGNHTISVDYISNSAPVRSTLLLEDFGTGPNIPLPEIDTDYYCYDPQDGTASPCSPLDGRTTNSANSRINDLEYSVTSTIVAPFGTWVSPIDNSGDPNGRYLAINVGNPGVNTVVYTKEDIEIIPNRNVEISLDVINLVRQGSGLIRPNILVEIVDSSGNILDSGTTGLIDENTGNTDWRNFVIPPLDPGANTTVDIVIRTIGTGTNGNDVAIDNIQAFQTPEQCAGTATINVAVEDGRAFDAEITAFSNISCNAGTDGTITFEVENFDTDFQYQVNGGGFSALQTTSTINLTGLPFVGPTGEYVIDIRTTDNLGNTCSVQLTQIITQPTAVIASGSITSAVTCNDDAIITASATGGTPNYEYQLELNNGGLTEATYNIIAIESPFQNAVTFTGVPENALGESYVIRVRDSNGCIDVIDNAIVVDGPELVTFDAVPTACYTGSNNGTIEVTVTNGNGGYQFQINGGPWLAPTAAGPPDYIFNNLGAGTYNINVRDSFGCEGTATPITINPQLNITPSLQNNLTCIVDATIEVDATGGSGAYTYEWGTSATGPWNNTQFVGNIFTTSTPGDFYFRVTDNTAPTNCIDIAGPITVSPAPDPVITAITPTHVLCNGDSTGSLDVTINTAIGNPPYVIDVIEINGPTNYGTQTTGLPSGDYEVTITDANGCTSNPFPVTINQPDVIVYDIDLQPITCDSSTGTNPGSITVENVVGGTAEYTYYLTGNNGYSDTYLTTSGGEDYTFTILEFGIYEVDVVDANGCSVVTTNIIASPPDDLDIDVSAATASCAAGGTAEVTVTTAILGTNYEFGILDTFAVPYASTYFAPDTPGGPTHTFTGLTPGITYTFVVHDITTDCYYFEEAAAPINSPSNMTAVLDAVNNITCTGADDGNVTFTIENYDVGATQVDYEVFNAQSNGSITPTAITGTITVNPPTGPQTITNVGPFAPGIYYILLTERNGAFDACSISTVDFTIDESTNLLSVTADSPTNDNCNVNAGVITAVGQFGTAPYEYQYLLDTDPTPAVSHTPPTAASAGWTSSATANVESGDYRVYIKDANDCIQFDDVTVLLDSSPEISLSIVDECVEEGNFQVTITLDQAGVSTTTPPSPPAETYLISINSGGFQTVTFTGGQYVVSNLSSGLGQTIAIRDLNGCGETEPLNIQVPLEFTVIQTVALDCEPGVLANAEIEINVTSGSGNYEYVIDGPGSVDVARTPLPTNPFTWTGASAAGSYAVTVFDLGTTPPNCFETITIDIPAAVLPDFTETNIDVTCNAGSDGSITLTQVDNGINPLTYTLTPMPVGAVLNGNTFENLPAGFYDVRGTGTNNCFTDIFNIEITEPSVITVPNPTIVEFGCTAGNNTNNASITVNDVAPFVQGGSGTYVTYEFIEEDDPNTVAVEAPNTVQSGANSTYIETDFAGGVYTINVYDDNGCVGTTTATILPYDQLLTAVATFNNDLSCNPGADGSITVVITSTVNDTSRFEYSVDNGANYQASNIFTGLSAGTHNFLIRHIDTRCIITASETIASPDVLELDLVSTSNIICFGSATGSADFDLNDGAATTYTSPIDYILYQDVNNTPTDTTDDVITIGSDTDGLFTINNLAAGTYFIEVTEANFPTCTYTQSFTIASPSAGITGDTDVTQITCATDPAFNDGIIEVVDVAGGWGGYQYYVSTTTNPDEFDSSNYIANPRFENLVAGTYEIWIIDQFGCPEQLPDVVLANPTPIVADLQINNYNCINLEGEIEVVGIPAINPVTGGQGSNYTYQLVRNGTNVGSPQNTTIFSGLGAGSYEVYILDQWGCNATVGPVVLTDAMTASASVIKPIDCTIDPGGHITITVTGGSSNLDYTVTYPDLTTTVSQNNGVFTNLTQPGEYVFIITDLDTATPCVFEVRQTLDDKVDPVLLDATIENVSCFNGSDGSITAVLDAATATNPDYTYELYRTSDLVTPIRIAQASPLFENLDADSYQVRVISSRGCEDTKIETVTEPTALLIDATASAFTCAANNTVNTATITVAILDGATTPGTPSGTSPYLYSIDNVNFQTSNTFEIVDNGTDQTITVFVTDGESCPATDTVTITALNTFTAAVAIDNAISCANPEQVTITVTETRTPGDVYSFELLPIPNTNGVMTSSTNTSAVFDLSAVGNYTFRVTNTTTGCYVDTAPYEIAPFDLIDVVATATTPVSCFGTATGALEINITGYTGNYDYQIFDGSNNPVGAVVSTDTSINPRPVTNVPGGNYYVRITETDVPLCIEDSNTITIISPAAALTTVVSIEAPVTCDNNQGEILVSPTGGYAPYDIILTNTTTGQVYNITDVTSYLFDGLSAGSFTIDVSDNGIVPCVDNATETLVPAIPITADITATPTTLLCFGDTNATVSAINVLNGEGVYQYQLNEYDVTGTTIAFTSGGQISPDFNNLGAGIYSITVSDGWNCDVETPQVTISEPTDVMASLIQLTQLTCTNNADTELTASGGTGPYEYSIDGTVYFAMTGGNSHTFSVTDGVYQYYVRDSFGCEAMISNQVTIDPIPPLTINIDDSAAFINCTGEASATITANATGGLGNYSYELFTDAALTNLVAGPQANDTFSGLVAGSYYVRVTSQDCEEVSGETLIVDPAPLQIDSEEFTDVTCFGLNDGTITVEVSGGTGEIQYAITPNLNQFDVVNTFDGLAPGVYDVIAQDRNGCFIPFQFTIDEPQPLDLSTVSVLNEVCEGDEDGSIEVAISGGTAPYSTAFNSNADADFIQDQTLFTDLAAGTYVIFVRDAQGCEENIIVEIESGVNLNAEVTPIYECSGDTPDNYIDVVLEDSSISADVLYGLDADSMQLAPDFTNIAPGMHTLTIAHANGCINIIDFEIQDFEPLTLTLEQNNINEITAVAGGGLEDYTFYFDGIDNGDDNTYIINRTDTYTVRVVDQNGCEMVAQIEMEFIDIEIPNFFTPDGDGNRDVWVPDNLEAFPNILTIIFDRYGRELYRMEINDAPWDGIYQGHNLPTGDYWYVIKLKGENDDREFVGHFTLYR
ncbi:T9SS type B sorting domain-containing protein [uncultured Croceitalea sp.]|uniref:T9SS type B sorting domain-containing protein n=1 Tax=uncultured Croceitalea sp. TaxID=1798908 RepID=UPI00330666CA